jgi:hypothetical protein
MREVRGGIRACIIGMGTGVLHEGCFYIVNTEIEMSK